MDAHQELLQTVYDHFRATGDWPEVRPLQLRLRHLGHLQKLAAEIGKDKILCDNPGPYGTCRLTLRGLGAVESEESDIAHLLHVVRALGRKSIESESGYVEMSDLFSDLDLSDLERRRVTALFRLASGVWNGISSGESGPITITPGPYIWYFENIESLDDYYVALQHAKDDEREESRAAEGDAQQPPALNPVPSPTVQGHARSQFVDEVRLEALRSLSQTAFDLRRLIIMCEELNICANNDCFHASAMLTRAITDHVPPIFNAANFDQVANNHSGGQSFKESMQHLSRSARVIANAHLHVQIRRRETLPSRTQVDFSRDLDVLLGEIVRILS